jgi:hypothetical protein
MTRALIALALLLCACDPAWFVRVDVRGPDNRPIEGAAVGLICPGPMRAASQATHSGPAGVAEMGSVGYFPACDVSVAAPGYETLIIRHDEMCPDKRCQHGTDIEATLGAR